MGIAVVEKAFMVLERLAAHGESITLARLSEQTQLPKPTAYRVLQTLVELGYVAQDREGRYCLTMKLGSLGDANHYHYLKLRAAPHMERLYRQFNETVNLGVLDGLGIHYIHVLETTNALRMMVQPNAEDQFYYTAIGRAIVAFLPKEEQDALVRSVTLRPVTPKTVRTKKDLQRILNETRERGWAIDDEEAVTGVTCFGVPFIEGDRPIAAVSITLPTTRLTPEHRQAILDALAGMRLTR
jgi:DNA-binding IclR family transcriptional regulator